MVAVVTAVAIYVLEKAVGKACKDAFKDTVVYKQLREFFRQQIDAKALAIAEGVRRLFASKNRKVSVKSLPLRRRRGSPMSLLLRLCRKKGLSQARWTLGEKLDR